MEIRVDEEKCIGCGACMEVCPTEAIQMNGGLVVLNQAVCSQCQSCVDICPTGAISVVELPQVIQPATVQPLRQSKPAIKELVPEDQKTWHSMLLAYARREIMPKILDVLINTLEQKLAATQSRRIKLHSLSQTTVPVPLQEKGWGKKRRKCHGQATRKLVYRAGGMK
jgi:Fe-S-cluster-containing hydrogenase component 2